MKFRKKPVEIEAMQFLPDDPASKEFVDWLRRNGASYGFRIDSGRWELEIKTLEDGSDGRAKHVASPGDWIIRGVQGEFYPCKPDIFESTYEAA